MPYMGVLRYSSEFGAICVSNTTLQGGLSFCLQDLLKCGLSKSDVVDVDQCC